MRIRPKQERRCLTAIALYSSHQTRKTMLNSIRYLSYTFYWTNVFFLQIKQLAQVHYWNALSIFLKNIIYTKPRNDCGSKSPYNIDRKEQLATQSVLFKSAPINKTMQIISYQICSINASKRTGCQFCFLIL